MNILQELYGKLKFFKIKEKSETLRNINKKINMELIEIEKKKVLIFYKLNDVRNKLTRIFFTQEEFKNCYVALKENITKEMTNNIICFKRIIMEMKNNLVNLEGKAKKLVYLRQKFNSEYLDNNLKDKMILFTKYFLNFFDSVSSLKDDLV